MTTGINSNLELQKLYGVQTGMTSPIKGNDKNSEEIIDFTSGYEEKNTEELTQEYEALANELGINSGSTGVSSLDGLTDEEIEAKIDELKEKRDDLEKQMQEIETEIEDLSDAAKNNILEALKEQKTLSEECEAEAKQALDENINAYIEANKEGGEGMSREELQENLKSALPNMPDLSDAIAKLTEANEQINEIDSLLGDLNGLIVEAQSIDGELEGLVEEQTARAEEAKCCDPQGFQDSEGNQYDFFIDKDGNNGLSNETEFLGYGAGWNEMISLDKDNSGKVDATELSEGGVMVYKTSANGTKQAMSIEEAFGKNSDLSIDLKRHNKAKQGVGPNNFSKGSGSENNQLLGTFDVNLNGETLNGYQTNDDINWLNENYDFTNPTESLESENLESDGKLNPEDFSEELQGHVNFFNQYTEISKELRTELNDAYEQLGLTDEQIEGINNSTISEAEEKAQNFFESITSEDKQEEEEETTYETGLLNNNEENEKEEEEKRELLAK